MKTAETLGRVLFGGFFLYSGINHFKNVKGMAEYTAAKNVPNPDLAVEASGALLLFGGASILLGVKPRLGVTAIAIFLASVSPVMHDFWNYNDPQQRQADMIQFMKNMAMLGATLMIAGLERGESDGSRGSRAVGRIDCSKGISTSV